MKVSLPDIGKARIGSFRGPERVAMCRSYYWPEVFNALKSPSYTFPIFSKKSVVWKENKNGILRTKICCASILSRVI